MFVVHEEKQLSLALKRFNLGNDFVNGTTGLRGFENVLHRGKVALEMAAAPGFESSKNSKRDAFFSRTPGEAFISGHLFQ